MKYFFIILLVVTFAQIVYTKEKKYVYKLVGQDWALESGADGRRRRGGQRTAVRAQSARGRATA